MLGFCHLGTGHLSTLLREEKTIAPRCVDWLLTGDDELLKMGEESRGTHHRHGDWSTEGVDTCRDLSGEVAEDPNQLARRWRDRWCDSKPSKKRLAPDKQLDLEIAIEAATQDVTLERHESVGVCGRIDCDDGVFVGRKPSPLFGAAGSEKQRQGGEYDVAATHGLIVKPGPRERQGGRRNGDSAAH